MRSLEWWPEPFRPTGNLTSDGARKQLGKSHHDPLTLLVRETMQNSWDAGLRDREIDYRLDGWHLSAQQIGVMRDQVFPMSPANMDLWSQLAGDDMFVLALSDRGTSGLTGPTRADIVRSRSEDSDFVDFVFNLGQPRDTEFGGGTYGYGKSILYVVSRLGTVIVYTRAIVDGQPESRLIGVAMGDQYEGHTGRHWWGICPEADVVEPLTGAEADEIAEAIGLPMFDEGETGTTLLILSPEPGASVSGDEENPVERTPAELMAYLSVQYVWNFWTKMLDTNELGRRVRLGISLDGTSLAAPDPNGHDAFYGFRQADAELRKARENPSHREESENLMIREIRCGYPRKVLGLISVTRFPPVPVRKTVPDDLSEFEALKEYLIWNTAPFDNRCHHVALMRDAELVVRYEEGEELSEGDYAGLFIVSHDTEIDQAFADSEPPAHDDWEHVGLPLPQKTYVRLGVKRVREALRDFSGHNRTVGAAGEGVPLGRVSEKLAGLVATISGSGPEIGSGIGGRTPDAGRPEPGRPAPDPPEERDPGGDYPGRGGGGTPDPGPVRLPDLDILSPGELKVIDGEAVCCVQFAFSGVESPVPVKVRAQLDVNVTNLNMRETEPPEGAERPAVMGWLDPDGTFHTTGHEIEVAEPSHDPWELRVSVPRETVFQVELKVIGSD